MKKEFLKGFILGGLIFSTITSFAAVSYNAITASFPILVNGQRWTTDKPIVTINGSTYLPLKALGDALNIKVTWNSTLNQVEIGESPTSNTSISTNSTSTTSTITLGMKNAVNKAKNYLLVMAFSRDGLIKQLEYEGFTNTEAIYGADNCGADWFEQASKKAKTYLNVMSFSRDGLIKQLEYEGFTNEQAIYGVKSIGY